MPKFFIVMDKLKPVFDFTDRVLLFICKILLIIDIVITTYAVAARYIDFIPSAMWNEEVILTAMAYMAVLSAAIALRHNRHISMSIFDRRLPKKLLHVLDLLVDAVVLTFAVIMLVYGLKYAATLGSNASYISMPFLSRFWAFFPVPLAGIFMIIFEIEIILTHLRAFYVKDEPCTPPPAMTEEAVIALNEAHVSFDACETDAKGGDAQ